MRCPQCGALNQDDQWNCGSCRINLYWATHHYGSLAGIRTGQGLASRPATPQFLLSVHRDAMEEREASGGRIESRVRQIARRAMPPEG